MDGRRSIAFVLVGWTLALAGCGGGSPPSEQAANSGPAAEAAATPSPQQLAERIKASMNDDRPPEEIVNAYFSAVRTSDLQAKLKLMTPKARDAWQTYGVEFLNAMSSSAMRVQVAETDMVGDSVDSLEAHVSIQFRDRDETTGEDTTEEAIVWLTPSREGWRVRGLAVALPPSRSPLVLDYESPSEVFQRLSAVAELPPEALAGQESETPVR